ncbi:MAG: N-acetylmuramoyl-L-alanine amidase [Ignavibacteria bacterium]|nr:N-acetylmuramoyl-L-alanine amidase [Ignavibacteria bacterium]
MKYLLFLIFLLVPFYIFSHSNLSVRFVRFNAKKGDKLEKILKKYELPVNNLVITEFKKINKGLISENLFLLANVKYKLPIVIVPEEGFNTILQKLKDENIASLKERIFVYNQLMENKGLKKERTLLWLPCNLIDFSNFFETTKTKEFRKLDNESKQKKQEKRDKLREPYYGENYKPPRKKGKALDNFVFYLVSGHGGPDPGAIGYFDGYELHEDEYAYDITLRLSRILEQNGAKVFMITIDTLDGIRDDKFLQPSEREIYWGGVPIPLNQRERLQECVNIVNDLYNNETKKSKRRHISINIHLDSRSEEEKVDVFFYYQENDLESKRITEELFKTFERQYEKYQPGRGYKGKIETRNLFMLRNSLPPTVYIELGNIQNRANQFRFIEKSNREAIAKWISLGLINYSKSLKTKKKQQINSK